MMLQQHPLLLLLSTHYTTQYGVHNSSISVWRWRSDSCQSISLPSPYGCTPVRFLL
eukprot:c35396_g1_i1 orf=80-247(+)